MLETMLKATITDIAREMGITPSTVSRALSGSPRVKEATRKAVEQKAREMGYERNVMASNLRKGVAQTVGIIVPRINRQFFSNVISSIESALGTAGYSVIICQTREKLENEINALKTMRSNRVAGVIMSHSIESKDGSHVMEILDEDTTLIQFDRVFSDLPGVKIVNDGANGSYQATKCLIRNGYRRIGTLAGYLGTATFRSRLEGYRKAISEAGLEEYVFTDAILRKTGQESAQEAIRMGCDALYCAGDFSALGAMDAAKQAGLCIPRDFGIVGTANEIFTDLTSPAMSSIEQNPKEMGLRAAEAFLQFAKGIHEDKEIIVEMKLIERESSMRQTLSKQ